MKSYYFAKIVSVFLALSFVLLHAVELRPRTIENYHSLDLQKYYVSEKLNGVRAYWNGKKLLSRGNIAFNPPASWIKTLPPFPVDGELYARDLKFEDISSIVKRSDPDWSKLSYYIFEVPKDSLDSKNIKNNPLLKSPDLRVRLTALKPYVIGSQLKILTQLEFKNFSQLDSYISEIRRNDGEGVVFRQKNGLESFKYKFYSDAECLVLDVYKGEGKLKGKLGSILCQEIVHKDNRGEAPQPSLHTKYEKQAKLARERAGRNLELYDFLPIYFKLGSGFSDEDRIRPPNIGDILTYKYYGRTKNSLPRHPVFLRKRTVD